MYDPEVTDLTLIVENQKFHVAKAVFIDVSSVFGKMLAGKFKEKKTSELELPGKKHSSFELFLRGIFPRKYLDLTYSYLLVCTHTPIGRNTLNPNIYIFSVFA